MIKAILILLATVVVIGVIGGAFYITNMLYVFGNSVPDSPQSLPQIITEDETILSWEQKEAKLLRKFEDNIYGKVPTKEIDWIVEEQIIDPNMYNGKGTMKQIFMTDPENTLKLGIILITPNNNDYASLLVVSSFCANHMAWPEYEEVEVPTYYPQFCEESGAIGEIIFSPMFGTYIDTYPDEEILDRGFAIASYYLGDVVPDSKAMAYSALENLSELTDTKVTGAIAAWAWGYNEVARVIASDPKINENEIVLYGHSRNGKATLLATAVNDNIAGVISHQSGTAGSTLSRSYNGESILDITDSYGYWFDPNFRNYYTNEDQLPIDQHQLVAMIAPRPAIYTGARWDKWSDPKGTLQSVQEASKVYELYGSSGSSAQKLGDFKPEEDISFFMRSRSHGVRTNDWDAFLAFLDAHFVE